MNLYEQQSLNRRRTVYVIVGFVAFLLFLGLGFDYGYFSAGAGVPVPFGTTVALMYGGGSAYHRYFHGDRSVLKSAGATKSIKHGLAHLCIADPLATHPPMQKRIDVLRAMAYQVSGVRDQVSGHEEHKENAVPSYFPVKK